MSNNKIILCIDLEHASEIAMDLRDAAPETTAKIKESDENKDWHLMYADSIEDQARTLREKALRTAGNYGRSAEAREFLNQLAKPLRLIPNKLEPISHIRQ